MHQSLHGSDTERSELEYHANFGAADLNACALFREKGGLDPTSGMRKPEFGGSE